MARVRTSPAPSANLIGALSVAAAMLCFSLNDAAIKFLSGGYALHEVVLIRSLVGLTAFALLIAPWNGGLAVLRTARLGMHVMRGLFVVFANLCFFLGLAAMPLANAVAIFFVSPLLITLFSVVFNGERVGPWRWAAVAVGLAGVAVMLRPGAGGFQPASFLPLAAAASYAGLHTLTRRIRETESAATMSGWIQIVFVCVSLMIGLALGDGRYSGTGSASLDFLFRAWTWPEAGDLPILVMIGLASSFGGLFISQGYRLAEAGFAAPFEYLAMPLAVLWGVLVFGEWPDPGGWAGIGLIMAAGLLLVWRETIANRRPRAPRAGLPR